VCVCSLCERHCVQDIPCARSVRNLLRAVSLFSAPSTPQKQYAMRWHCQHTLVGRIGTRSLLVVVVVVVVDINIWNETSARTNRQRISTAETTLKDIPFGLRFSTRPSGLQIQVAFHGIKRKKRVTQSRKSLFFFFFFFLYIGRLGALIYSRPYGRIVCVCV
jgi:hypothetical protein